MRNFNTPGRSAVLASNGMCATSHPLAAKVAVQILEAGGNAADAAIAGAVLLGICEPQSTGIGGDCFALIQPADGGDIVALNGSGRAPAGLDTDALRAAGDTIPLHSPHAVTLPGAVDAICTMSRDWGRIGLKASLAPAIHYAEAGVPIAPRVAFDYAQSQGVLSGIARQHYLWNDTAPRVGQLFRSPGQAEVLRRIAMQGRAGFYEGEVAQDMVASLNTLGGTHSLDDFAGVTSDYATPIRGGYGKFDLVEHPPNGQGATAILLLNILSQFDLAAMNPSGAQRVHIEAEATKLAYDARDRFIADMDHTTRLDHMTSMDTARALAAQIDPKRAQSVGRAGVEAVHKDTVYITVVDRDRMAVSFIYSIFHSFGSGLASDRFGVLFQNRGAGFTLEDGHPNEAAPGKRPMHTIIPGMLQHNGRTVMPFGVMGGSYQSTGHARFITNMVDYGMDAQTAIDAPRSFAEGDALRLETGYGDDVARDLADMGHKVERPAGPIGGAQAIMIHADGVLEGASDPRKDGAAIGY